MPEKPPESSGDSHQRTHERPAAGLRNADAEVDVGPQRHCVREVRKIMRLTAMPPRPIEPMGAAVGCHDDQDQ